MKNDHYGFSERFRTMSGAELVRTFNEKTLTFQPVTASHVFFYALLKEMEFQGIDTSVLYMKGGIQLRRQVALRYGRLEFLNT